MLAENSLPTEVTPESKICLHCDHFLFGGDRNAPESINESGACCHPAIMQARVVSIARSDDSCSEFKQNSRVNRKSPSKLVPNLHYAVFKTNSGQWSWQVLEGDEVVVAGTGYQTSEEAYEHACDEYSRQAERFLNTAPASSTGFNALDREGVPS